MNVCKICNSTEHINVRYDRHTFTLSPYKLLKINLPLVSHFIPASFTKLKALSQNPFKGNIRVCQNCGYGLLENPPSPEELSNYYNQQYWSGRSIQKGIIEKEGFQNDFRAQSQLELVENTLDKALEKLNSILEIGAGNANFSLLMRNKINRKLSIDVCEPGDQWLEHYKFHQIKRIAEFFPFSNEQAYDYIHTSHWLEHMDDLAGTIQNLDILLKPRGYVFVEVPNCEYDYWNAPELDTPHIQFFTLNSLRRGFENAGFDCLTIGEYGITFKEYRKKVKVTQDKFGPKEKGFWLRAIFQKKA